MNSVLAALAVVLLAVLGCGLILWGLGVGFATFVSGDSALLLTGGVTAGALIFVGLVALALSRRI